MATRKTGSAGDEGTGAGKRPRAGAEAPGRGGAGRKKAGGPAPDTEGGGERRGAARGGRTPDLRGELRQFVSEHPHGWGHDQWEHLLHRLRERGHDTADPDRIGMQLERERLNTRLEGVEGVSPQRARSLAERFGTLYSLRHTEVDDIARQAKIPRELAERIKRHLD